MKKVLKFLGILILILVVGYLVLCIASPAEGKVEATTTIDAPNLLYGNKYQTSTTGATGAHGKKWILPLWQMQAALLVRKVQNIIM